MLDKGEWGVGKEDGGRNGVGHGVGMVVGDFDVFFGGGLHP